MANSFTFSNQNALPNGVYCVLTGYVHTAATNIATVTDKSGKTVAQISGSGGAAGNFVPMNTTAGNSNTFQPQAAGQPYTITFTKGGGGDVQFLFTEGAINSGTKTYAESYTFITEDYTDSDYNDATVYFTWNLTAG